MAAPTSTRSRDLDTDRTDRAPKWPAVVLGLLLLLVLFIVVSLAAGWVDFDVSGNADVDLPNTDVDTNAPDVDVDGGDLPDVDVDGGDLPDVDVEPAA